jgi:hypothetical protein
MIFDVGILGEVVLKLKTDYGTVTYHRYCTYKSGSASKFYGSALIIVKI